MALVILTIAATIALPAIAFAAIRWRRALLLALPFLAVVNGLTIPLGASAVRLDQLAACLLAFALAAAVLAGTRTLRLDATMYWLAALLGVNVLASVLNSPARSYSLAQCGNLASVWIIYVVLVNFLDSRDELEAFFHNLVRAGVTVSVAGIVAYALAVSGIGIGGAEVSNSAVEHLTRAYGAYATMVEPNIFGSFTGALLVLAVGMIAFAEPQPAPARVPRIRMLAAVSAIGLVLSFTRAAWLGVGVAIGWSVILAARDGRHPRNMRMLKPLLAACVIGAVLLVLPGAAGSLFRFKVVNLVNVESQTGALRLLTYALGLQQTAAHPIIGWGTYSFAPLVAQGADFQRFENWRNLWIGNYLLLAVHDTGAIGLTLWIGLLGSILSRGIRAARAVAGRDPSLGGRTLALTLAVASLLVPFLATTGFSLGSSWLLIGLLGAHARVALPEKSPVEAVPTARRVQPPDRAAAVAT